MPIVIRGVERLPAEGMLQLHVEIDGQATRYKACFDSPQSFGCEYDFFMLLSDRGLAEQGSSAAYLVELTHLFRRVVNQEPLHLPLILGAQSGRNTKDA